MESHRTARDRNRRFQRPLMVVLPLLSLVALHAASQPATVKPGIVSVTGGICVGVDCSSEEVFPVNAQLRLKENNTRIGLLNTDSVVAFGNNWVVEANDSSNEGPEVFRWKAQSLTQDAIKLSDGRGRSVDCVPGTVYDSNPNLPTADTPLGEPILRVVSDYDFDEMAFVWTCEVTPWFTEYQALSIGSNAENTVTLGYNSQPVAGAVTVGSSLALRTIAHVGTPAAGSDMLPFGLLTMFPEKKTKIIELRKTIALLQERVATLENADADGDGVRNVDDTFPTDPDESADTDGDGVGDNADAFPEDATEILDSDGDGVGDNLEQQLGTGVSVPDSDGDGYTDGDELGFGTDSLDSDNFPLTGLSIPLIWGATQK